MSEHNDVVDYEIRDALRAGNDEPWVIVHRNAGPSEVYAAAKAALFAPSNHMKILHFLVDVGNATDPEIVEALGITLQSVTGARNSLVKHFLVRWTGGYRLNDRGNPCKVWEPTPAGCLRAS